MPLRQRIRAFAHRPNDTAETTFAKSLIFIVALCCCMCGLVWSALYVKAFGYGVTAALPLGFVVIVGGAIFISAQRRDHMPLVHAQITCIMWVTAFIQWTIGSPLDSGLVVVWAFLGPIGALFFLPLHRTAIIFGVFLFILGVTFALEPALLGAPQHVSDTTRSLFFVMNVGTSLTIVFAAAAWFTKNLQRAMAELKEAQLQLVDTEKQAVIGRLVAGILHEMNTPLGAIRSSTQTMAKVIAGCGDFVSEHADENSREGKRALRLVSSVGSLRENVENSITRLSSVVDGLSRFVSLDEADKKSIDVRESLDTAVSLLTETLGDRITVERRYDEALPRVLCFPAKLNQVFLSVLQNAAEAIEAEGTVEITAQANSGNVEVGISDDGRGIEEHLLEGVFEIGFSKQAGRIGMQLGLPMSKRHLDEIGGAISIESSDGVGTKVRISLSPGGPQRLDA